MKFLVLSFILIFSTLPVYSKDASCAEALAIALEGAKNHLNQPTIDSNFLVRSLPIYLDLRNPYKNYLTQEEIQKLTESFSSKKEKVFKNLKSNNCADYAEIDLLINKGKVRWLTYLKKYLNDPSVISFPEIERNDEKVEYFHSEKDLENYAKSYVGKYLRNETSVLKRTIEQSKQDFSKIISSKEKPNINEEANRGNLLARSLFLAFDPHSDYIPERFASQFLDELRAETEGIGIELKKDDLGAKIFRIIKNSPSDKIKKLKKGDIIVKINDLATIGKDLPEIVSSIQGQQGSNVKLEIVRHLKEKKETLIVNIKREPIALDSQKAKGQILTINNKRILVINLPSFYFNEKINEGSSSDIIEIYQKNTQEKPVDGLILDLRFNGGGSLDEAIRVSGLFIKKPIAAQVKAFEGVKLLKSNPAPIKIEEPLLVLINKASASASEIVAGALKDYNRAIIVGDERTYGKGTVQTIFLNFKNAKLGLFKVTTAKFYTPQGSSTQIKGVTSDIIIPSSTQLKNIGELNQRYVLPWTEVDEMITPHPNLELINKLKLNSQSRVKQRSEFNKFSSKEKYTAWINQQNNELSDLSEDEDSEMVFSIDPKKDLILEEALNITSDLLNK